MLGKEYLAKVVCSVVGHLPLAIIFFTMLLTVLPFFFLATTASTTGLISTTIVESMNHA
jgi:hypothetical protein